MELKIKKCKIGGTYYDIEYCDDLRDEKNNKLSGRIVEDETLIRIDKDQCYQGQLKTLLHEIMHALTWEYNLMKIKKVEDLIEMLTNSFLALIVDNPKIIHKLLDFYQTKRK